MPNEDCDRNYLHDLFLWVENASEDCTDNRNDNVYKIADAKDVVEEWDNTDGDATSEYDDTDGYSVKSNSFNTSSITTEYDDEADLELTWIGDAYENGYYENIVVTTDYNSVAKNNLEYYLDLPYGSLYG